MFRKGHVHWFDNKSGEGFIKDDITGDLIFVHKSATPKGVLKDKERVSYKILEDTTFIQVVKIKHLE